MLENISATVSGLIKKPVTTFKESVSHISQHIIMNTYLHVTSLQVHKTSDYQTDEGKKLPVETVTKNIQKINDVNMSSWL